jgi:hypothetical protein
MKWISVKDRLPEYYTNVLVYCTSQFYSGYFKSTAWRANDGGKDIWTITASDNIIDNVTHWMPLPQPPKQD